MGATVYKDRISSIIDDLKPAIHEVVQAQANCIFLLNFFAGPKNYEKFFSFLKKAEMISNEVDGWRDVVRNPLLGTNEQIEKEKGENLMRIVKLCNEITSEYFDFQMWLRQEAARDLAVVE
jgi:DNA replication protein DnaD